MKNLDQIRAKNALAASQDTRFSGANDGEVVKKIPTMIRESGLLGALAFACEAKEENGKYELKNKGYNDVFVAVIKHLNGSEEQIGLGKFNEKPENFINELCRMDSAKLRAVTAEILAYLAYLRRFAKKSKTEKQEGAV
jgi:CRISPR type III-B/RAMP module-associated protein Cmr5